MISTLYPAIALLIPLIAGLSIVALPTRFTRAIEILSLLLSASAMAAAAFAIAVHGPLYAVMGGWARATIAITYYVDSLALIMAALVLIAQMLAIIFRHYAPMAKEGIAASVAPAFIQWMSMGAIGLFFSYDLFHLFVCLEITALCSYIMMAMSHTQEARRSSFLYLIVGSLGASFFLLGIGFILAHTGTLHFDLLKEIIARDPFHRAVMGGACLMLVGLLLKTAIFPFHLWLFHSYTHAPHWVTLFIAAIGTKLSIFTLAKLGWVIYPRLWEMFPLVSDAVRLMAIMTILGASYMALKETQLKRLFIISSFTHVGYMVIMLTIATPMAMTALMWEMMHHSIAKAVLFGALIILAESFPSLQQVHMRGLWERAPLMAAIMLLTLCDLVGIPPSAGFVSKWLIMSSVINAGLWVSAVAILIATLSSAVYTYRLVESMMIEPPKTFAPLKIIRHHPLTLTACVMILYSAIAISGALSTEWYQSLLLRIR